MGPLDDELVEAIQALRRNGFSGRGTAEVLQLQRDSVKKHDPEDGVEFQNPHEYADKTWENINEALPDDVDPRNVVEREFLPEDMVESAGNEVGEDPFYDEERKRIPGVHDPDHSTPGDFIEHFFEHFEVGVKGKFVNIQAARADRRMELPKEERMRSDLKNMPSGISGQTAAYVAEEYAAAAQDYVGRKSGVDFQGNGSEQQSQSSSRGDFMSVGGQQQQQGGWVQMPDGTQRYGRMEEDGQGGMRFVPMQPPGQQGGGVQAPQQHRGGSNPEVAELKGELEALRREIGGGGSGGMMEEVKKFKELQTAIQDLQNDGGAAGDEQIQMLQRQIQQVRQEIGGGQQPRGDMDTREVALQRMMDDESVDTDSIMAMLDRMEGEKDPEILKMEKEMEMKEKEMERSKEQQEKMLGAFESIASTAASAFAERLANGDGDGSDASSGGQPQQTQQTATDGAGGAASQPPSQTQNRQAQQSVQWECPSCGAASEQNPAAPGRRCPQCDFSRVPCPDCTVPIEIPPESEREDSGCPECGEFVPLPEDLTSQASCLSCDWIGPAEEATGSMVECDNCGSEHPVVPDARQA